MTTSAYISQGETHGYSAAFLYFLRDNADVTLSQCIAEFMHTDTLADTPKPHYTPRVTRETMLRAKGVTQ